MSEWTYREHWPRNSASLECAGLLSWRDLRGSEEYMFLRWSEQDNPCWYRHQNAVQLSILKQTVTTCRDGTCYKKKTGHKQLPHVYSMYSQQWARDHSLWPWWLLQDWILDPNSDVWPRTKMVGGDKPTEFQAQSDLAVTTDTGQRYNRNGNWQSLPSYGKHLILSKIGCLCIRQPSGKILIVKLEHLRKQSPMKFSMDLASTVGWKLKCIVLKMPHKTQPHCQMGGCELQLQEIHKISQLSVVFQHQILMMCALRCALHFIFIFFNKESVNRYAEHLISKTVFHCFSWQVN